MKIRIAVLAVAIVAVITACSKPKQEKPVEMASCCMYMMSAQDHADTLALALTLTDEQKAKVLDLFKACEAACQKPDSGTGMVCDSTMKAQMMNRCQEMNAKMKEILTPDQFAKFETIKCCQMGKGPCMPHKMNPEEMVDKMAADLKLTDDQKVKLLEVFKACDMDDRKPQVGTEAECDSTIKAEMLKMHQEMNAKIKAILTAEQFAQLEKMKCQQPPAQK